MLKSKQTHHRNTPRIVSICLTTFKIIQLFRLKIEHLSYHNWIRSIIVRIFVREVLCIVVQPLMPSIFWSIGIHNDFILKKTVKVLCQNYVKWEINQSGNSERTATTYLILTYSIYRKFKCIYISIYTCEWENTQNL